MNKIGQLAIILLLVSSLTYAYQYSATQGQKTVYGNDVQCHSSICTLPIKFCNNFAITKSFKPSLFLDLPIRKIYNYTNYTVYDRGTQQTQVNVTRYTTPGNVSYQETINVTIYKDIPRIVEGYAELPVTTKKNSKQTRKTTLRFQPFECKELAYEYNNILLPIQYKPLWKYDIGEDDIEILDPIVNSTDYTSNFTLDNNASRTTVTIVSAFNISSSGSSIINGTDVILSYDLEEAGPTFKENRGIYTVSVVNNTQGRVQTTGNSNLAVEGFGGNDSLHLYNNTLIPTLALYNLDFRFKLNQTNHPFVSEAIALVTVGQGGVYLANGSNPTIGAPFTIPVVRCCFNEANVSGAGCSGNSCCAGGITNLTANTWYHVRCMRNSTGNAVLYLNGNFENASIGNFSLNPTARGIAILDNNGFTGIATTCGDHASNIEFCANATVDQVRLSNNTDITVPGNGTIYATNVMSVATNVTRFRVTLSSLNPSLVNNSISLDGGINQVYNVSTATTYNWTYSIKNLVALFYEFIAATDSYGTNLTFGSLQFQQNINNRNVSHNNTLDVQVNCTDGLTPIVPINYTDNTTLFNIGLNNGSILHDPAQSDTGNYQIRINCTLNNVTTFEAFNYTIFNSALNVTSASIGPSNPQPSDTLNCNFIFTDAENDNSNNTNYRWYVNNNQQSATTQTLSTGYGALDNVTCSVLGNDGLYNSTNWINSTAVTISEQGGGSGGSGETTTTTETPPQENQTGPPPTAGPPNLLQTIVIENNTTIFINATIPDICGDKICGKSEDTKNCELDCPFNVDTFLLGWDRIKECASPGVECERNALYWLDRLLLVVTGIIALLLIPFFIEKQEKKRRKKR